MQHDQSFIKAQDELVKLPKENLRYGVLVGLTDQNRIVFDLVGDNKGRISVIELQGLSGVLSLIIEEIVRKETMLSFLDISASSKDLIKQVIENQSVLAKRLS